MHQRQLGKSGPKLSAIGIGAMSFTDFYGTTSEAASHAVLTHALDLGVNHIDTANVYGGGLSESVIGRFLAKQGAQKTKLFHIATKAGIAVDKETGRRALPIFRPSLTPRLHSGGWIMSVFTIFTAATVKHRLKK